MTAKLRVRVGSQNPVKVNAAKTIFETLFPEHLVDCEGISVSSGVPDQPIGQAETRQGAINRVAALLQNHQADFYVAMEGGVDRFDDGIPATFAFVVIHNGETQSVGRSAQLPLPECIYQRLLAGEELGPVMDSVFGTTNVKQKGGAIGLLTHQTVTRQQQYEQSLLLTMAPFLHQQLFAVKGGEHS